MARTLDPGKPFPDLTVPRLGGGTLRLGRPEGGGWTLLIVYRGKHCPVCHRYLSALPELMPRFAALGVSVQLVSGDPEEKARAFVDAVPVPAPVGYDLSVAQMRQLGLYVSEPRSPQETDRPFPEPGLFVINAEGNLQIVDISNAPFARPDLAQLAGGLEFIFANDYPVRGTLVA